MLPAGILAFMLPVEPEEGFYADPPIQHSKDQQMHELHVQSREELSGLIRESAGIWAKG
jgi:hypothetical protein